MISPCELKTIDDIPLYFSWWAEYLHQQPICYNSVVHNPCKQLKPISFDYGKILEILCGKIQTRERQCFISVRHNILEFRIYDLQKTNISVFPLNEMESAFRLITEEMKKGWELTKIDEYPNLYKPFDKAIQYYLFKKQYIWNIDTLIRFLLSIFEIDPLKDMFSTERDEYPFTFLYIRNDSELIKKIYRIFKFDILKDFVSK